MNNSIPQQGKIHLSHKLILEMRDSFKYNGKFKKIFEWYSESTKYRYPYNGEYITIQIKSSFFKHFDITFEDLQKIKKDFQKKGLEEYDERKRIFEEQLAEKLNPERDLKQNLNLLKVSFFNHFFTWCV